MFRALLAHPQEVLHKRHFIQIRKFVSWRGAILSSGFSFMHLTFLQGSLQTATGWKPSSQSVAETSEFCSTNRVTLFTELSIWRIIIPDIRRNYLLCHLIQTWFGEFTHSSIHWVSRLWRPELEACHSSHFNIDVYSACNFNLNFHTCPYDVVLKDKLALQLQFDNDIEIFIFDL
jgi:hypothetical protein